MATRNDITGDLIKSKPGQGDYGANYDRIFRKQPVQLELPFDGPSNQHRSDHQRDPSLVEPQVSLRVEGTVATPDQPVESKEVERNN